MADIQTSERTKRIVNRIINGLEVKYDPAPHAALLVELFAGGHDIAAFCHDAEIARSTFYKWVLDHDEFARAYEVARESARIWWENQVPENGGLVEMDGVKFNTKLWSMIMKNRFDLTDQRKLHLPKLKKAKDFNEQIKILSEYAADGSLTSSEANQLSGLILAAVRVEESTVLKAKLDKLEAYIETQVEAQK